jgi:phospholipid/cholesterol/gamma-HCH transport system permease protein
VRDIFYFVEQCGPQALAIVALISVLVGMILAYLGSVQLRLFGAEVYVANLVAIGMVREMGALMTAVIMAGRTGAAYAAQLGAMQANEEVDAITTLGLSPMEYLVLPRLLALVAVMPLLCVCANVLGLAGGALVAAGMDVGFTQFAAQAREAVSSGDIFAGLFKSLVFGALIAIAGCQAGLRSGRSSAAVGQATTSAVVNAIVYLVVADAALNILYDKLGI